MEDGSWIAPVVKEPSHLRLWSKSPRSCDCGQRALAIATVVKEPLHLRLWSKSPRNCDCGQRALAIAPSPAGC
eukprot:338088-Chlamydomonas_euryale.AAC.4